MRHAGQSRAGPTRASDDITMWRPADSPTRRTGRSALQTVATEKGSKRNPKEPRYASSSLLLPTVRNTTCKPLSCTCSEEPAPDRCSQALPVTVRRRPKSSANGPPPSTEVDRDWLPASSRSCSRTKRDADDAELVTPTPRGGACRPGQSEREPGCHSSTIPGDPKATRDTDDPVHDCVGKS